MSDIFILAMERGFFTKILQTILAAADTVVYWLSSVLMQATFDIANFPLSEDIFGKFERRVFLVLGVFMLFKLTFSMLTYLVNPDKMTDKEQGIGKIATRTVIVLIMLIALPTAFNLLNRLQTAIIPAIPRLIVGMDISQSSTDTVDDIGRMGDRISWSVFSGFFHYNPKCIELTGGDTNNLAIPDTVIDSVNGVLGIVNDPCESSNSIFKYEYRFLISTVAGVFMAWVLLGICITVAVRMFKLLILRMLAPIPIISYIDPKSSKEGAFSNWTKTLITTWTELFINLAILYLIVFLINEVLLDSAGEVLTEVGRLGFFRGTFFLIFIILGLFMFAKKAPQFILDSLGIKSKGTFAKTLGLAGSVMGFGGSGIAAFKASRDSNDNVNGSRARNLMRNVGAGLFGGAGGVIAGGSAALDADKDQFNAAMSARNKYNATSVSRLGSGSTAWGRLGAGAGQFFLGESAVDRDDRTIKDNEAAFEAGKKLKGTAESKALSADSFGKKGISFNFKSGDGKTTATGVNYREYKSLLDAANGGDESARASLVEQFGLEDWKHAGRYEEEIKEQQTAFHLDRVANGYKWIDAKGDEKFVSGDEYDGTTRGDYEYARDAMRDAGVTDLDMGDLGDLKKGLGKTSGEARRIKIDRKYKARAANRDATKKS